MTGTNFRDQLTRAIPALTSYARALTRNLSEADDLVQDTLERALTRQALYVETGPLISWLNTIMQHLFIDRVRSRRRREHLEGVTLSEAHGRSGVKASQEDRRFLTELQELLPRLPRNGGTIIMAIGVQGHGYDRTAARLNVRPGTIRSRLSRSRTALSHASLMCAPDPRDKRTRRRRPSGAPAARLQPALGLWDRPRPTGA
jgi:RNA polymerase sigma-70 factor (ECF subfamily)